MRTDLAPVRGAFVSGQKVFSRYTLEAQVGRGGMGVVWRARDEKLDRPVALKFLPAEIAADAEAVRDLKLETRRCLDLTHANIVRVYDFVEEGADAAIAMEYVEGESLAKLKATAPGGCLAAADLTSFVAQLCAALRYAHKVAKVAHHDLKPANVLVTREGVLKITDFGIARSLTEAHTRRTGVGTTSGTVSYMSPQQIGGEKPTVADDLYALGATLYDLLTGKPPFFRGDAVSLRNQVIEENPAPLEAHRRDVGCTGADIPPQWSETILACLAKQPGDRPATADDVAARLGVALEPMVSTARLSGSDTTSRANGSAPERRSLVPWLISVGGVLVVLAAAAIYFGIYLPEQRQVAAEQVRLAVERERTHQTELARQAERARQAEEQQRLTEEKSQAAERQAVEVRRKEAEARGQMTRDQQAYAAVMAQIAALSDNALSRQSNDMQRTVRNYLRIAPESYRDQVEKAWNDRQAAWRAQAAASRPGSLRVETEPVGASVVLYPRNEHKTSPALFEEVKPGDISLRIEQEGFEAKDVPFVVKPGVNHTLDPVKLVAIYGTIAITSDPSDVYVLVEGNGRRIEGRTPFRPAPLPPGGYKVTYQKRGWRPLVKSVTVGRGKEAGLSADLRGFSLLLRSTPPGAQVAVDNELQGVLIKPIQVGSVEPRDYRITATLAGYEDYSKTISVTRNETVVIALTEKPLPRALRRLAGVRWRHDSFATTAELAFNVQGRITGSHHAVLGGTVRDAGTAEAYNAATGTITAHFTANQSKSFYTGAVQIKIVDDQHLEVSWKVGGTTEKLGFEREKGKK